MTSCCGNSTGVADLHVEWVVVFSGGEPLMHPEIFRLCQAAKRQKCSGNNSEHRFAA